MRFVIAMIITFCFLIGGSIVGFISLGILAEEGASDDALAGLFVSGMLLLIGILLFFAARKSAKARAAVDPAATTAMVTGMMLGQDHDLLGGDDGFDGD